MSEEVREPCSFYGKITNLQWHLVENGYQACVGGLAPYVLSLFMYRKPSAQDD
jgi:hypothetical protein